MAEAADKRTQTVRIFLLVAAVILAAASCIDLPECSRGDNSLLLQHLGTLFLLLPLAADLKLRSFTTPVCVCLFIFICLHLLGARYIYSNVPYHRWAEQLFGIHLAKPGVHANKFDRLVHFAFGLLLLPMFLQIAERWLKIKNHARALLAAWLFVQGFSILYEVFELLLAMVMDPKNAENYNGQQGDDWDALKDMLLALIGSTVTAAFLALRRLRARAKNRREA